MAEEIHGSAIREVAKRILKYFEKNRINSLESLVASDSISLFPTFYAPDKLALGSNTTQHGRQYALMQYYREDHALLMVTLNLYAGHSIFYVQTSSCPEGYLASSLRNGRAVFHEKRIQGVSFERIREELSNLSSLRYYPLELQ